MIFLSLQFQEIGNVLTPQDSRYFALPLPDRSSAALSATNKPFDLFWPKSYFTSFALFLPLAMNILILVFSWKCLNPKSVVEVVAHMSLGIKFRQSRPADCGTFSDVEASMGV